LLMSILDPLMRCSCLSLLMLSENVPRSLSFRRLLIVLDIVVGRARTRLSQRDSHFSADYRLSVLFDITKCLLKGLAICVFSMSLLHNSIKSDVMWILLIVVRTFREFRLFCLHVALLFLL
jgi:hypothetical protein